MKIQKKVTLGVICVLLTLVLGTGTASAWKLCSNAEIKSLGVFPGLSSDPNSTDDDYTVTLHCQGLTTAKRYFLSPDLGASGYATVLTAYSLGDNVEARLEEWAENSLITDIKIIPTN